MFVLTTLATIGLPMLSGFVGEFLILTGSMQVTGPHHLWTALATTGVIFSAAYMLTMIQRVFYASTGPKPESVAPRDLDPREHLAMWPLVALFLIMGVASPFWLKAIDTAGVAMAAHPAATASQPDHIVKLESETYRQSPTAQGGAH
jgi:NADH-quinone oxidoreductase subunit M